MSCRVLFISTEDFRDRVDLTQNILDKYIVPNIALVQDRYVKKVLCKDFYDELLTQVENDTLTTANETLMDDYIKPYMVYRSYARYIAGANVFSTASGFRKYLEDNSESASREDMSSVLNLAESDAQYYENELRQFLENNASDYPTWQTECHCEKKSITDFKISKIGKGKFKKKYNSIDQFYDEILRGVNVNNTSE